MTNGIIIGIGVVAALGLCFLFYCLCVIFDGLEGLEGLDRNNENDDEIHHNIPTFP